MQVILPSAFNQPKDRKKVLKSTSNSHVGATSSELVEGKNVNSFKGKSQNLYLNNGVNNVQNRENQIQIGQQQQQQGMIMQSPYLSLSQSQHLNNNVTNHMLSHQSPLNQHQNNQNHQSLFQQQQQQQQQQMQNHNSLQQLSNGGGQISNSLGGGNYSSSAHQSSEKKQQALQMQLQQQMQMNKSSTTFAKFKDLFGSKRLSEANAKQFLENSNFNNIANNSANFNKSSRITAKIQVNKMTAAAQNQNQNTTSSSTNQKSIISPKRAQIINHGYIIEDKKKKSKQLFTDIASQMPQNMTNQQYQQNNIQHNLQQQALLSGNQPYFKINRDLNKQSTTGSEDNHSIPNLVLNNNNLVQVNNNNMNQQFNNQNVINNNILMANNPQNSRSGHSTQSASKGSTGSSTNLVDSNQNRNIDINKLSEYKKQLESQLENVNTYIEGFKSFSLGQSAKLPNRLSINVENLQDDKTNLFDKKMSLDEIVMISAPQSVRNTKDSNIKSNQTNQASSQYVHHSNNNSVQFFNFNNKNGVQAAVTLKDDQQGDNNSNGIKNYLSQNLPNGVSQETKMTYSQKIFPKSTTQHENNVNQGNNNQQFFLSTKSSKTHVKRQTLDSTFSQTLQSQRMPTSNHQLSSILSQSTHHLNQNAQVGGGQHMTAQQVIPNNLHVISEQDTSENLGLLLNMLKEKISKVLNNYKSNKESSDKLNAQLLTKLNLLQVKNSNNPQSQINIQQPNQNTQQQSINGIYHTKSNSLQQVQQIPQQALPLRNHNNLQKSLSQSQQFFLQKNNENQQLVGHGNNFTNNQINHLISNMNYQKSQNIYQNQQNQQFNQNLNSNQQDPNINQNREVLKKEYYTNPQQQLVNQQQILQQHNGIQQQQILIDSTLGYNTNNNNNIIPISKNFPQSPPFSTKKSIKNQQNVIQTPETNKQFQFYQNSSQRMTQSSHINQINQVSPSQMQNIGNDYMQQQQ